MQTYDMVQPYKYEDEQVQHAPALHIGASTVYTKIKSKLLQKAVLFWYIIGNKAITPVWFDPNAKAFFSFDQHNNCFIEHAAVSSLNFIPSY